MSVSLNHFGRVQKQSAWQQLQSWRSSQAALNSTFQNAASTLSTAFGTAMTNQISGGANLAAQAALTRIQSATTAATAATTDSSGSTSTSGSSSNATPGETAAVAAGQAVLAAISPSSSSSSAAYTTTSSSSLLSTPSINILS